MPLSAGLCGWSNYRFAGRYMIVDRLFAQAELRLGGRKGQDKVRIVASRKQKS